MQVAKPLTAAERDLAAIFHSSLHQLAPVAPQGIAVGLSGGGDSWALALLAFDYCQQNSIPFIALTVDHGLRAESAVEAETVAAECARRNMPHQILTWDHTGVDSRKQERARTARYDLMGDYCTGHGFTHLLTAHHADDQAETVLMRFAKASGSAGLSGMPSSRPLNDQVTLLRPLLSCRKADLKAYAVAAGVPIIEDPSNNNEAYGRGRLRAAADILAREGLTVETLLKTAAVAQDEAEALKQTAHLLILDHTEHGPDSITVAHTVWASAPIALRMIAWQDIWRQLTGSKNYTPGRDSVRDLCEALIDTPVKRTLGGIIAESRTIKGQKIVRFQSENPA